MTAAPVRVLLCDDSAAARSALSRMLARDPEVQVVGRVADGRAAVEAVSGGQAPDVVLLDLEMPVMDGLTALPLILRAAPRASVIVASALSQRGAAATMAALRAGAVDYVPKPSSAAGGVSSAAFQAELLAKVKGWARMRARAAAPPPAPRPAAGPVVAPRAVAIGSSTGGPQALSALVAAIARPLPVPVLAAQHMPPGFTAMLAEHLDRIGPMRCAEARDGEALLPGRLYLAPGDRHLLAEAGPGGAGGGLTARLSSAPPENFCRPAVDPLLRSLSAACRGRVVAAILTGMGQDGLQGCRALVAAGGTVLAQDEASSVVWGMPGAVARAGLAAAILPPGDIGARIAALAGGRAC